jgi:hypothetical protein
VREGSTNGGQDLSQAANDEPKTDAIGASKA